MSLFLFIFGLHRIMVCPGSLDNKVLYRKTYAGGTIYLRWTYSDNDSGCAWYWHINDVEVFAG